MSNEVKRYYISMAGNLVCLKEMTPEYAAETGFAGLIKGEDYDALRTQLEAIRAAVGEEVHIVAEMSNGAWDGLDDLWTCSDGTQLMTVAQHQRIVAAMAAELENARKGFPAMVEYVEEIAQLRASNNELRAELEEARKQEPVAYTSKAKLKAMNDMGVASMWPKRIADDTDVQLYALPPLAGQVSVPRELLERAAEALEEEINARYAGTGEHPALMHKYECDMEEVRELRALLAKQPEEPTND